MKKLLVLLTVVFCSTASANEVTAWKNGFYEGAQAGYNLCQVETKERLKAYEDLVNSVFNTKALMFAGRFPLPTAYQKVEVVRKPDGTAEIVRKWEVLPPAYFPISAIESLKQEFTSGVSVIPAGWGVVVRTDSLPTEKIAYVFYSAKRLGESPVYLPDTHLLVLGVFSRKADAEDFQKRLLSYGISAQVQKIKKPIKIRKQTNVLTAQLQELAEKIKQKEEKLLGIKTRRNSIDYLISLLDEAEGVAKSLEDNPAYRDFNFLALEMDISSIKHNVLSYLTNREPYKKVVLYDPYREREESYQKQIEKLKRELERLKKENQRLRLLVGEKEKTDSSIIKKYLKGEL